MNEGALIGTIVAVVALVAVGIGSLGKSGKEKEFDIAHRQQGYTDQGGTRRKRNNSRKK